MIVDNLFIIATKTLKLPAASRGESYKCKGTISIRSLEPAAQQRAGDKRRIFKALQLMLVILAAMSLTGCVTRESYDRDIGELQRRLVNERSDKESAVHAMELKLKDRAKTLEVLTERYSKLEQEKLSQGNLRYSKDDLEFLLKKIKELKVEVRDNITDAKAVEMTETLKEMEHKVNLLLGNPGYFE